MFASIRSNKNQNKQTNAAAFDCMQSLALLDFLLFPGKININNNDNNNNNKQHIENKLDLVYNIR